MAARSATSATWDAGSAAPFGGGSIPARCHGRCCRPANASAPPPSGPPNTACSSAATPATSPNRDSFCRGGICRFYNPPMSVTRTSIRTGSPRRSAATSRPSISSKARGKSRSLCAGRVPRHTSGSSLSPRGSAAASPPRSNARSRSTSCWTATSRRPWAPSCAKSCSSRARSWRSTDWCCAISITSISGASACPHSRCR